MLSFYDSRSLSQKLTIPLARFKRWSREFLPPDNLGGYQSGYARQYNLNEAFTVYLGGFMVHDTKLLAQQTRKVLRSLQKHLPNLYSDIKAEYLRELKLAVVLNNSGDVLCKMWNGSRILFEDEAFEDNVKDFVRVVLVGRLLLRFVENLNRS